MSKTITDTFKTHLQGELTTIATCWKITRLDGEEFFFTDHDRDITIDGDVYEASSGVLPLSLVQKSTLAVDNMEIVSFLESDKIREIDIIAGKFDGAIVDIFVVEYEEYF